MRIIIMILTTLYSFAEAHYSIDINNLKLSIKYLKKTIIIEHIPGDDCERYTIIDKEFYQLPKYIQEDVLKVVKKRFITNDTFDEDIFKKEIFLWDKSCLDLDYFHPSGIRGINLVSEKEKKVIVSEKLKNIFGLNHYNDFNSEIYSYIDKLGLHYILIYNYVFKPTSQRIVKVFSFQKKGGKIISEWKLKDFSNNGKHIYIHMDRNFQDIDKDGIVDPIISYRINDEIKILTMYKNKKIGIRSHNINKLSGHADYLKEASIYVDKPFYRLPKSIQKVSFEKLRLMLSHAGDTLLNYEEALKNNTLLITADQKLIDKE